MRGTHLQRPWSGKRTYLHALRRASSPYTLTHKRRGVEHFGTQLL